MDKFRVAAKAFIMNDGKLLLIKRADDDIQKPGIWEIPGGRLEPGEEPISGLKREIKEEVGIDIDVLHPFSVRHFTRADGQMITLLIFLSKALNDNVKISKEHSNFEWVPMDNVKEKFSAETIGLRFDHF